MIPAYPLYQLGATPLRNVNDIQEGDRVFYELGYMKRGEWILINKFKEADVSILLEYKHEVTTQSLEHNNFLIIKG